MMLKRSCFQKGWGIDALIETTQVVFLCGVWFFSFLSVETHPNTQTPIAVFLLQHHQEYLKAMNVTKLLRLLLCPIVHVHSHSLSVDSTIPHALFPLKLSHATTRPHNIYNIFLNSNFAHPYFWNLKFFRGNKKGTKSKID